MWKSAETPAGTYMKIVNTTKTPETMYLKGTSNAPFNMPIVMPKHADGSSVSKKRRTLQKSSWMAARLVNAHIHEARQEHTHKPSTVKMNSD